MPKSIRPGASLFKEAKALAATGAIRFEANGIPAQVYLVEQLGEASIVDLRVGQNLVRARVDRRVRVREGETVHLAFNAEDVHVFDAGTRQRL